MKDEPETDDIAKLADNLTRAQIKMLHQIGDGQPREFALGQAGFALIKRGLVFVNELGARHLTDEGRAVRAHLGASHDQDA